MKQFKGGKVVYTYNRKRKGFNVVSLNNLQRGKPSVEQSKAERDLIKARLYNPNFIDDENDEL